MTDKIQNTYGKIPDRNLFEQAKSYALTYMETLHDCPVFPLEADINRLAIFDEKMPDASADSAEVLRLLHKFGSPATTAQSGGRYFGFVCGSVFPAAIAAKWLSDCWDQNSALYVMSPVAAFVTARKTARK